MAQYVLIESQDPFESGQVAGNYALARDLVANGDRVTFFLVQNGVQPARRAARANGLDELVQSGARVVADAFSLKERAMRQEGLRNGIESAPLELVLDALVDGHKVVWL